jgi:glycosyltransferase involved in cell wall biosynthesis
MTLSSGITVVICCYNSSTRLPQTLEHLLKQDVPSDVPCEVILVDNASTDSTSEVARSLWPEESIAPLLIVHEPQPGLINARKRGLKEAKYGIVSFVDDDNWLAPNWIQLVSKIMAEHPEVGACGGRTEAVFESEPPSWFIRFQHDYAVGTQGDQIGDITWSRGHLWGAGMTLRRIAWQDLMQKGFRSLLTGRKGALLASGEDYEICYALRLAGWRLWYDPRLILRHYIPTNRVNWRYMRRLHRSHGATRVGFEPYEFAAHTRPDQLIKIADRLWVWQAIKTFGKLVLWHGRDWFRSTWTETEGDERILAAEYQLGRLIEILLKRQEYDKNVLSVYHANWRKTGWCHE